MSDDEITQDAVADAGRTDHVLTALTWLDPAERDELIAASEASADALDRVAELLDLADARQSAQSAPDSTG
jgi:hypothetical protein